MIASTSFHGDIDRSFVEADTIVSAVIQGLHDIGACLGNYRCQAFQCPGIVRKPYSQALPSSVPNQALLNNSRQQIDFEVASGYQHRDVLTTMTRFRLQDSGEGNGTGPFCYSFALWKTSSSFVTMR